MRINRNDLIKHLSRVQCHGRITEAVFSGAFSTAAMTEDTLLFVSAPGLTIKDQLPEPIGLTDLGKCARALNLSRREGAEGVDVDVTYQDHRLVIIDPGVRHELITAEPRTVGTHVDAKIATSLLSKVPRTKGLTLTQSLVDEVTGAFNLYKAEEVRLQVRPRGGKVIVGNSNSDQARFDAKELKAKKGYDLLFGPHLIDVLAVVTDFSTARLVVGGPEKPVAIVDGEYQYVLSLRQEGNDTTDDDD